MMICNDRRCHHKKLNPCRDWYVRTLRLLEDNRAYWEQTQPTLLCGFAMDRTAAAIALAGQQPGTFLVRCGQRRELPHIKVFKSRLLLPGSAASHAGHRGRGCDSRRMPSCPAMELLRHASEVYPLQQGGSPDNPSLLGRCCSSFPGRCELISNPFRVAHEAALRVVQAV